MVCTGVKVEVLKTRGNLPNTVKRMKKIEYARFFEYAGIITVPNLTKIGNNILMLEMHSRDLYELLAIGKSSHTPKLDFGVAYIITPQKGKNQVTKGMKNLFTTFLWLY